jgi:hypothetical protein
MQYIEIGTEGLIFFLSSSGHVPGPHLNIGEGHSCPVISSQQNINYPVVSFDAM